MNSYLKLLIALISLTVLSGCDPESGVNLNTKCTGNCANHGGKKPNIPDSSSLSTAGIYRDQANDHVATIDQNGRVLFWDNYATDRELEQRALVQRRASLNTEYYEENNCMIAYNGTHLSHAYSFTKTSNTLRFNTSCGDARFYLKQLSESTVVNQLTTDYPVTIYHAAGESLELTQTSLRNIYGDKAELLSSGFLSLPAPNTQCVQEYLIDQQAIILLSSPNCQNTGFESGIYMQ
ncbi:hypothetical protein [Agarivorans sp. Alg241-V36]|uniref:hypothetical protein n=1 Tax=Agarivorans sp. Alg241-V36 TaxID=2305992 RepID=UPI0013D58245|nr:hypothetical protein [Agarivorans sp. Alg241-V36]